MTTGISSFAEAREDASSFPFGLAAGSLFSEAGRDAIGYGPGDIAEAHTAGEWVRLDELAQAEATYERLLAG